MFKGNPTEIKPFCAKGSNEGVTKEDSQCKA